MTENLLTEDLRTSLLTLKNLDRLHDTEVSKKMIKDFEQVLIPHTLGIARLAYNLLDYLSENQDNYD